MKKPLFSQGRRSKLCCERNITKRKYLKKYLIQPASGDAGGAIGAALTTWYQYYNNQRIPLNKRDCMKGSFLGPSFSNVEIEAVLKDCGANYMKLDKEDLIDKVSDDLARKKFIG